MQETFAARRRQGYVRAMKRATIKDVAKAAGVSVSVVSRTFSDGSVAEGTRERVREAARALGYRPSHVARGLVSARTNTVTLVTGHMTDPFDALFLELLAEALAERGIRLVVAPASKQTGEAGGVWQALDDRSDAVVIAAGTMPLAISGECLRAGLPVILAGRFLDAPGVEGVAAENADGGRQAAGIFLRTGCRRPAFYGLARPTFSDRERGEGFREAMSAEGLEPRMMRAATPDDPDTYEAALALLSERPAPDAVFCATDRLAFGVIEAARALGLRVPEDVSIVGFNNIPAAARRSYRLSTVDYPVPRVVAEVVAILDRRLAEPAAPLLFRRIPVQLVVRETTREAG
jgi:DNA-binding LacI/PurR family transcriptional regulator